MRVLLLSWVSWLADWLTGSRAFRSSREFERVGENCFGNGASGLLCVVVRFVSLEFALCSRGSSASLTLSLSTCFISLLFHQPFLLSFFFFFFFWGSLSLIRWGQFGQREIFDPTSRDYTGYHNALCFVSFVRFLARIRLLATRRRRRRRPPPPPPRFDEINKPAVNWLRPDHSTFHPVAI